MRSPAKTARPANGDGASSPIISSDAPSKPSASSTTATASTSSTPIYPTTNSLHSSLKRSALTPQLARDILAYRQRQRLQALKAEQQRRFAEREMDLCANDPAHFIHEFCQIYDATTRDWLPFHLWDAQAETLKTIDENRLVVILKARQLGMTWLVLAYALWLVLFRPAATILIFSKRDDEATYLLGVERMKGMHARLPDWMKSVRVVSDNEHEWMLSNGSIVRAFPTTAGDSYTATLAFVDEADLVPDLNRLMNAVKPTIDGGGRMILLSRVDKATPQSEFKNIYRAAKAGTNGWKNVFLPWHVRPARDAAWYEAQKADILSRTTSLDDLHQQYPATDTEALAPSTLDKRIAATWLEQCFAERAPLSADTLPKDAPSISGLQIYQLPEAGRAYVIGADPAEGNPTSDDSACEVLDKLSGAQVATLAGKYQPAVFASYIDAIGTFFNRAAVLVERNNHGHAVLLWLREHSALRILTGFDDKDGWHSTALGKTMLYDTCADAFRNRETMLHNFQTFTQLSLVEGATLRAPSGEHDDRADAYALALAARVRAGSRASADWV